MKNFKEFVAETAILSPKHQKLLHTIKNELANDLHGAYDGDHKTWSEVVHDVPSNTLEDLYSKIPRKHAAHFDNEIRAHIRKLGKS